MTVNRLDALETLRLAVGAVPLSELYASPTLRLVAQAYAAVPPFAGVVNVTGSWPPPGAYKEWDTPPPAVGSRWTHGASPNGTVYKVTKAGPTSIYYQDEEKMGEIIAAGFIWFNEYMIPAPITLTPPASHPWPPRQGSQWRHIKTGMVGIARGTLDDNTNFNLPLSRKIVETEWECITAPPAPRIHTVFIEDGNPKSIDYDVPKGAQAGDAFTLVTPKGVRWTHILGTVDITVGYVQKCLFSQETS